MAKNNNKGKVTPDPKCNAMKVFNGLRKLNDSDLGSGLARMTDGTYIYVGPKGTDIDGRGVGLACFMTENGNQLVACGATRFATQALGAVGRNEQREALNNPDNIGTVWKITVTGTGVDKVHTFDAI